MTRYRAGADLERAAQDDLEASGYFVIRSAGSHGIADLVAMKGWNDGGPGVPPETLFVQCKTNGATSPADRGELLTLAARFRGRPLVARWEKTGRDSLGRIHQTARTVAYGQIMLDVDGRTHTRMQWTPDYALEARDG